MVAYLPAVRAGYIWDDDQYVYNNANLRSAGGLTRIWVSPFASPQYYPLVFTTFWIEHQLWGNAPLGYHFVNVLLHACNAALLWGIFRRLNVPGAGLAAAIFALHPVHVESVAWVTERKNVLSGLFYLLAARAYFQAGNWPRVRLDHSYIASLLFFCCALLSKTVTASLPAAMLLVVWLKHEKLDRATISPLLPFFVLGLLSGAITAWIERTHVGAYGPDFDITVPQRVLIAGQAIWFYLGKLLWPQTLIFIYPRWQLDASSLWQWSFPIAAFLLLAILGLLHRKLGRGPLVAALYFGGTLLPALGFINVYPMRFSFVADHFQYLASIGPILLISAGLASWKPKSIAAITPVVSIVLAFLTWRQSSLYENEEVLWLDVAKRNPSAFIAHNNLGYARGARGELETAIVYLNEAVRLSPQAPECRSNLAAMLLQSGRIAEAEQHLREALRLSPRLADAHANLGVVLLQQDRKLEAIASFQEAIHWNPALQSAQFNLGATLHVLGRSDEAIPHLAAAVELNPADTEAQAQLQMAREARRSTP